MVLTGGSKEGKKGGKERRRLEVIYCVLLYQHDAVFKAAKGVSIS